MNVPPSRIDPIFSRISASRGASVADVSKSGMAMRDDDSRRVRTLDALALTVGSAGGKLGGRARPPAPAGFPPAPAKAFGLRTVVLVGGAPVHPSVEANRAVVVGGRVLELR